MHELDGLLWRNEIVAITCKSCKSSLFQMWYWREFNQRTCGNATLSDVFDQSEMIQGLVKNDKVLKELDGINGLGLICRRERMHH